MPLRRGSWREGSWRGRPVWGVGQGTEVIHASKPVFSQGSGRRGCSVGRGEGRNVVGVEATLECGPGDRDTRAGES